MTFLRRGVTAIFLATLTVSAFAQSYPTKTDIIAREVMNKMSTTLGWSFVIDNKPGSGGNLGVDAVAKAAPDGYTIALGQSSNLAINPSLFSKMPYDSVKDLAPISLVASSPMVLVVGADSPFKTLADVVAASKAKPGSLNFATSGNGTVAHLSGEVFQKAAVIKFTHVPYKGAAQATTDLIGGQFQLSMSSVPTLIGHIRSGKMRPIAVTSLTRVDDIPQVPTIAESGYKGFETITWFGFVAPAHTPKDIVSKLNAEINKALQSPDVKKKLSDQGADILGGSPEKFGALIKSDIAYWAPVIKESGAKLD
jgi:tripartite-type tricarboxylate transporter receptor subunit TctC